MKLLWTESNNVIDKLIHFMTGEDCGHFAILFESRGGKGVVFEANLLGAHPAFYLTWMKAAGGRTIVHSKEVELTPAQEDALWDNWVEAFDGKEYDFFGALFVGLCKWRKRIFGTPMPVENKWARKNTFYCDVIYQLISGLPGCPVLLAEQNEMSSPHDVWLVVNQLPEGVVK